MMAGTQSGSQMPGSLGNQSNKKPDPTGLNRVQKLSGLAGIYNAPRNLDQIGTSQDYKTKIIEDASTLIGFMLFSKIQEL